MTKLPERKLLDGTKSPETTTGEFRLAMGNLVQYLLELLGEESTDKETARQTLGIDLTRIQADISTKVDRQAIQSVLDEKADKDDLSLVGMTGDYSDLANKPIVCGMIIMWSGSKSAIPDGWALCNGDNGTPDLRDRFVVGAGNTYDVFTSGGTASASISSNTGETTLTVNQIPRHNHSVFTTGYGAGINCHTGTALHHIPKKIQYIRNQQAVAARTRTA